MGKEYEPKLWATLKWLFFCREPHIKSLTNPLSLFSPSPQMPTYGFVYISIFVSNNKHRCQQYVWNCNPNWTTHCYFARGDFCHFFPALRFPSQCNQFYVILNVWKLVVFYPSDIRWIGKNDCHPNIRTRNATYPLPTREKNMPNHNHLFLRIRSLFNIEQCTHPIGCFSKGKNHMVNVWLWRSETGWLTYLVGDWDDTLKRCFHLIEMEMGKKYNWANSEFE